MTWLTQNLVWLFIIGWVAYVFRRVIHLLERRIELLEKRGDADLVNVVNRMAISILRPAEIEAENIKAHDAHDAANLVDHYVGHRLFTHIPALRRVLSVKIGVTFDFLREKGGITAEDLKGLEMQFNVRSPPSVLFPANGMVIEEWATHSVVTDFSGLRKVIYPDHRGLGKSCIDAVVLWSHSLASTEADDFDLLGKAMEVVLHEGFIKFWLRGGRFMGPNPYDPEPEPEYRFVEIPLQETNLEKYRVVHEPTGDPVIDHGHRAWIRHYEKDAPRLFETPKPSIWWELTVNDVVNYTALH